MALFRRDPLDHLRYMLRCMGEAIPQYRARQLQGDAGAEAGLNVILDQWLKAHDQLVLADYERWATDNQSPDYHG